MNIIEKPGIRSKFSNPNSWEARIIENSGEASRDTKVVATCRRPDQAEELQNISNVEILHVHYSFIIKYVYI